MARKDKPEAENISGYFRKIFAENPKLLRSRSNDELLERWLKDHPKEDGIPYTVKVGLQNIKSVLRSRGRKRTAIRHAREDAAAPADNPIVRRVVPRSSLEILEERIDECLIAARMLDPEGLESIIQHLRRARNEVVWKMGQ